MVTRKRLRSVLNTLALYTIAGLLIGYFWVNAHSGNHGLNAKQTLDQEIAAAMAEQAELKRERTFWERRVRLLQSGSLDRDMLDERGRVLLDYSDPRDLILIIKRP